MIMKIECFNKLAYSSFPRVLDYFWSLDMLKLFRRGMSCNTLHVGKT